MFYLNVNDITNFVQKRVAHYFLEYFTYYNNAGLTVGPGSSRLLGCWLCASLCGGNQNAGPWGWTYSSASTQGKRFSFILRTLTVYSVKILLFCYCLIDVEREGEEDKEGK